MNFVADVQAIVLAAGRAKRFKTEQTKLTFPICGQEMILYPLKLLSHLHIPITVITGYQGDIIRELIKSHDIEAGFVEQRELKGTGHAVICSRDLWYANNILIMGGDTPLITQDVLHELFEHHQQTNAVITFVTAHNADPSLTSYGRVVLTNGGISIIEECDLSEDLNQSCCINAGIYLIRRSFLEANIDHLTPFGSGEIGLPDIIQRASSQGLRVETIQVPFDAVRGVNTLKELWAVEHIKRSELISYWMSQGVRFSTAQNVHIDINVTIGAGTFVGSGVLLLQGAGRTDIGEQCFIEAFSLISNSTLHPHVRLLTHSAIYDATIENGAVVGPFAHVRKGTVIGPKAHIGNFVEVSASTIGEHSKAKHLAYLGNAQIGSHVNIGAGSVICNFDGFTKHPTTIEDNAFVGSNTTLIAPLVVGHESLVAAGSTITEDVPPHALAIARCRQEIKEGYARARKERARKK